MAAWMLHGACVGEEAGARNLVFFRVKWLQPTMKGTSCVRRLRLRSVCLFFCLIVTVASSCFGCACACVVTRRFGIFGGVAMCVDTCRFATWCCETHCNGCMNVAWGLCWGGSRSTKPCVFPCKVAAADDERYLLCAAVAAAVCLPLFLPHCNGGFKLLWVCLCVRSYRVFWNLWLQIALEWLHDCCHLVLPCA